MPWQSMLRQCFRNGFGKHVISTYKRPSRKHPALPGLRRFTIPTVHYLIDCSGSIGQVELEQFMGEAYEITRICPMKAYAWDVVVHEIIDAKRPADVINRVMKHIKGGGGTEIKEVLKTVSRMMRPRDIVVVITDGYIYDLGDREVSELFTSIASRSAVAIFCTTNRIPQQPDELPDSWRVVKIDINQ